MKQVHDAWALNLGNFFGSFVWFPNIRGKNGIMTGLAATRKEAREALKRAREFYPKAKAVKVRVTIEEV